MHKGYSLPKGSIAYKNHETEIFQYSKIPEY